MEKGFFEYKVRFYEENEDEICVLKTSYGVVYAKTYAKAMRKIEAHYDMIEDVRLYALEPFGCYDFFEEEGYIFKLECKEKESKDGTGT